MNISLAQEDKQFQLFGADKMDRAFFLAEESSAIPEFAGARFFENPDFDKTIMHVNLNTVFSRPACEPKSVVIEKRKFVRLLHEEDAVRTGLGAGKELQRAEIPPPARMDLRVTIKTAVLHEAPVEDQRAGGNRGVRDKM